MPKAFSPRLRRPFSYKRFFAPFKGVASDMTPLQSRGNKPLELSFEQELMALVLFHLEEHRSGQELLQFLEDDETARLIVGVPDGIRQSTFYEAINTRGLSQMIHVFIKLHAIACDTLPNDHPRMGRIVAIDGSLIDATLTMEWADYRNGKKKAKAHFGYNLNQSIPSKIYLADGKSDERPYVSTILNKGETGVIDRYYQCYHDFDTWQNEEKHFVCRIKASSRKTILEEHALIPGGPVFFDALTLLGTQGVNQTEKPVRVIGYKVDHITYWLATDRLDLSEEDIMAIYKMRWNIETFFGWWKQHLNVYHRLARSSYGMMVQLLAGLITYLLLVLYCHEEFKEKVSIRRVRQLRNSLREDARRPDFDPFFFNSWFSTHLNHATAKT